MKKHHLVYKITNTVNNKFYIGVHSTDNIDDGYMGSGKLIKKAIIKHGVRNFTREILFSLSTRAEALEKEKFIVDCELLAHPNCYNLIAGGGGAPVLRVRKEREKAIYSKDANEIKTELFERFNDKIKYVFSLDQVEVDKYIDTLSKRKTIYNALALELDKLLLSKKWDVMRLASNLRERVSSALLQLHISDGFVRILMPSIIEELNYAFNNKFTNKRQILILASLHRNGFTSFIKKREEKWDDIKNDSK